MTAWENKSTLFVPLFLPDRVWLPILVIDGLSQLALHFDDVPGRWILRAHGEGKPGQRHLCQRALHTPVLQP